MAIRECVSSSIVLFSPKFFIFNQQKLLRPDSGESVARVALSLPASWYSQISLYMLKLAQRRTRSGLYNQSLYNILHWHSWASKWDQCHISFACLVLITKMVFLLLSVFRSCYLAVKKHGNAKLEHNREPVYKLGRACCDAWFHRVGCECRIPWDWREKGIGWALHCSTLVVLLTLACASGITLHVWMHALKASWDEYGSFDNNALQEMYREVVWLAWDSWCVESIEFHVTRIK